MNKPSVVQEGLLFCALAVSAGASLYCMAAGAAAAFWPESGFLVALLLLTDRRRVAAWAFVAASTHFALGIIVGHRNPYLASVGAGLTLMEGLGTTLLCRHVIGAEPDFTDRRLLRAFVFKCVLPVTLLCVSAAICLIAMQVPLPDLGAKLPRLVAQEFFGIALIAPGVVVASGRFERQSRGGGQAGAPLPLLALIASEAGIFALHLSPALFLIFPWIVAVSLTLGARAAGLAAVSSSTLAFAFSLHSIDSAVDGPASGLADAFLIQLFAVAASTTALLAAGAIDQQIRLRDAALAASEAAERATVAKSEFLALMSHEIRTPLNGVLGTVQVLARQPLGCEQKKLVNIIDQSGRSLLVILNDMLDLSKLQAGQLMLESIPFELDELINGVVATFSATANGKGIGLFAEVEEAARGGWIGDPTRVRQILSNLVSNALKFTQQGAVRVIASAPEGRLAIAVEDTGEGIPKSVLPKLFESFCQADASTARRHGGTGLGLSICRRLSSLMGGSLDVESDVGRGTTFLFCAPLEKTGCPADVEVDGMAVQTATFQKEIRILVAEDNLVNQVVLKSMLAEADIELTIVGDGEAALKALETQAFDVVLMDVRMPVMDGLTAVRALRVLEARGGSRRTPVVALTADAMEHQVVEYKLAGMDGYVEKPIDIYKLFSTIEKALSQDDVSCDNNERLCAGALV